jgi:hypothetical protein
LIFQKTFKSLKNKKLKMASGAILLKNVPLGKWTELQFKHPESPELLRRVGSVLVKHPIPSQYSKNLYDLVHLIKDECPDLTVNQLAVELSKAGAIDLCAAVMDIKIAPPISAPTKPLPHMEVAAAPRPQYRIQPAPVVVDPPMDKHFLLSDMKQIVWINLQTKHAPTSERLCQVTSAILDARVREEDVSNLQKAVEHIICVAPSTTVFDFANVMTLIPLCNALARDLKAMITQ